MVKDEFIDDDEIHPSVEELFQVGLFVFYFILFQVVDRIEFRCVDEPPYHPDAIRDKILEDGYRDR